MVLTAAEKYISILSIAKYLLQLPYYNVNYMPILSCTGNRQTNTGNFASDVCLFLNISFKCLIKQRSVFHTHF